MSDKEPLSMGEIIKILRLKAGLTQEELGTHLGVQKSAVRKWEKGAVENIKRTTIQAMAELFEVTPPYLMGYDQTLQYSNTVNSISDLINMVYGIDIDKPIEEWGAEEFEQARFTEWGITNRVSKIVFQSVGTLLEKIYLHYNSFLNRDGFCEENLNVEILSEDEMVLLELYRGLNETDKSEIRGEIRGIKKSYKKVNLAK